MKNIPRDHHILYRQRGMAYITANDITDKRGDTVFLMDLHMPETDGFALPDQMEKTFKAQRRSPISAIANIHRISLLPTLARFDIQ